MVEELQPRMTCAPSILSFMSIRSLHINVPNLNLRKVRKTPSPTHTRVTPCMTGPSLSQSFRGDIDKKWRSRMVA
jgi:hypothetical protein